MNKSLKIGYFSLVFILMTGLFAFPGCATGEQALQNMSPEEKAFVEKIKLIKPEMTESDVEKILGKVKRGGGTLRPS